MLRPRIPFLVILFTAWLATTQGPTQTIPVVVWDEQPSHKQAHSTFLGNEIAAFLASRPGLAVPSVKLDDADQGLGSDILDNCQVLLYGDHFRHHEVKRDKAREIVRRIKSGQLAMISLHSARWSLAFIEAVAEVTRNRTIQRYASADHLIDSAFAQGRDFVGPAPNSQITRRVTARKFPHGRTALKVDLPNCAFPIWREEGKPSYLTTLHANPTIARGIPARFTLPATEMYDEPCQVPQTDEVVCAERWTSGEWFRSDCVCRQGRGTVFPFRPGPKTFFPSTKEKVPLKIIENAVRWLANRR